MLELVDQSDPRRLVYRCSDCGVKGISAPPYAPDGCFTVTTADINRPFRLVRHECTGVPFVEAPPKPKRGRPAKATAEG